jgi:hypothetical protein
MYSVSDGQPASQHNVAAQAVYMSQDTSTRPQGSRNYLAALAFFAAVAFLSSRFTTDKPAAPRDPARQTQGEVAPGCVRARGNGPLGIEPRIFLAFSASETRKVYRKRLQRTLNLLTPWLFLYLTSK